MMLRLGDKSEHRVCSPWTAGRWVIVTTALTSAHLGCAAINGPTNDAGDPPTVLGSNVEPAGSTGNDSFEAAESLVLPNDGSVITYSDLASVGDVDVFDLGPVSAGERLSLSVVALGDLDPVAALFDSEGHSLIINDDRSFFGGDWNAYIDVVLRRDTDHCYAVVASSAKSASFGDYSLQLDRFTDSGLATTVVPQLIYLNFEGDGNVVIGPRTPIDVPVFDASSLSATWYDQTDKLIELIVSRVRSDFEGLEVVILSSHEQPPPDEPYSVVHFGAYDPALLGVAENVDEFNERQAQPAIVFVDTFAAFMPLNPSIEEMAQALANVGSHEIGHLLGLNHTQDARGIMDISASLQELLGNQSFSVSPLDPSVFPLGNQDAIKLLVDTVGGDDAIARATAKSERAQRSLWYDQASGPSARASLHFSSRCGSSSGD